MLGKYQYHGMPKYNSIITLIILSNMFVIYSNLSTNYYFILFF